MRKHNGVSFKKFCTYALEDSVVNVYVCMKVYANTIVCALIGILPSEARVPSEQEVKDYADSVMSQYSVMETGGSMADFTGMPVNMIIAMTPPGRTISQAMDGIFN